MIDRYVITNNSLLSDSDFVKYEDHLKAVESLEYDLRYVNEQLDITIEELKYYKELYFALCEQSY